MKKAIRTKIKELRNQLTIADKEIKDHLIVNQVLNDPNFISAFKIGDRKSVV